ncbi:hypothetical protein JTE90_022900 [Oedothorax gibbosus]|uniref:Uncharacterized protein n=1 Tax=Oedothorax gibbosus TaxID=931172 RepID=A0AAV6USY7_9ARAC|nr:hypothetical protein JTE90_022900 [Oedothorax gibbosus]
MVESLPDNAACFIWVGVSCSCVRLKERSSGVRCITSNNPRSDLETVTHLPFLNNEDVQEKRIGAFKLKQLLKTNYVLKTYSIPKVVS